MRYGVPIGIALSLLAGCTGGWQVASRDTADLPPRATRYARVDVQMGDSVRATVSSDPEPVDILLYLDVSGQETDLASKAKVKQATLEGVAPRSGAVLLKIGGADKATAVRYTLETRPSGQ